MPPRATQLSRNEGSNGRNYVELNTFLLARYCLSRNLIERQDFAARERPFRDFACCASQHGMPESQVMVDGSPCGHEDCRVQATALRNSIARDGYLRWASITAEIEALIDLVEAAGTRDARSCSALHLARSLLTLGHPMDALDRGRRASATTDD